MIDIEKLLARCDFHIGRGENMTIDPAELKEALKPAPKQKPFCYMSDKYEVCLFASKPDNPAYADFFPVFKELQPAPDVAELVQVAKNFDATLAKIKNESIELEKRLGLNQKTFETDAPPNLSYKSHVYIKRPSNFRISVGVCLGCAWVVLMFCIAVGIISRGA